MQSQKPLDDSAIRDLLGRWSGRTRVRVIVQTRRPQKAKHGEVKDSSYTQLPGHSHVVEIRTLREFRRLWRSVQQLIDSEGWRDGRRPAAPSELPAAGLPVAGDRS